MAMVKGCCDICGLDLGDRFFRIRGQDICWTCKDLSENTGGLVCLRWRYQLGKGIDPKERDASEKIIV